MPPGQREEQTTGKIEEKGRIKAPRLSGVRFSASGRTGGKQRGSVAPRYGPGPSSLLGEPFLAPRPP